MLRLRCVNGRDIVPCRKGVVGKRHNEGPYEEGFMLKAVRPISALAVLCAVALVAAGCGGGGGGGKSGGSITIGTVGPDSYDPVLFQTVQAVSALHLVYTPLIAYRDATGASSQALIPGLAET